MAGGGGDDDTPVMDMTPLIDVVFMLLIFFMLCTVIAAQDNTSLRLPNAVAANKPEPKEKKLFTVDIAPSIPSEFNSESPSKFGWFCYGEATPRSVDEMRAILTDIARQVDPNRGYEGFNDAKKVSENAIYLRVDSRAPAGHFAALVELMVEARMYKIRVAIMKEMDVE